MVQQKFRPILVAASIIAISASISCAGAAPAATIVAPGVIEDMTNPNMAKIQEAHNALAPSADEIVVYYFRPDSGYANWGFWIWAEPGGDGSKAWPKSSKLGVREGVGYLRFRKNGTDLGAPGIGEKGTVGLIVRRTDSWTKDGENNRSLDLSVSREWVVFSGEAKACPYGPYVPTIDTAKFLAPDRVLVELSGRHALSLSPSDNGFSVTTKDGAAYRVVDVRNADSEKNRSDNFARRALLQLEVPIRTGSTAVVSHPSYRMAKDINADDLNVTLAEASVPPADYRLGALYDTKTRRVEFRLWAPLAEKVSVRLYGKSGSTTPNYSINLSQNKTMGVWTGTFDAADADGMFYEYSVTTGGSERIALDPYAKSMDAYRGTGVGRGAIVNSSKTLPRGGWEGYDDVALVKREDAIIYEVSVRDFTISPDSGCKAKPGSYNAFIEKIPYLKNLGITHVQLMPVLNFYFNDETNQAYESSGTASGNNYNWGYDPHSYFTPEGWFSSDPSDPYARIVELKTLIKELHKAGIGVLLDVVYNHTATPNVLGDAVPGYFYRTDERGNLTADSGCGNDVATERTMARRLISDSIYYLVDEYKIDGFRFDLMGLIDTQTILEARARASALPGKADVLFEGEGWKMYHGRAAITPMDQNYMSKTEKISVFNDEIRDLLKGGGLDDRKKGFITNNPVEPITLFSNLIGQPRINYIAIAPGNNLNYTEAHDNLTMHDNIALNLGLSDTDVAQRVELSQRLKLGNFFVLTSQGVAFLHAGQECGRSKPKLKATTDIIGDFVSNSYDASDTINQFPWINLPEYKALSDYTRGLIAIRRANDAFRIGDATAITTATAMIPGDGSLSIGWRISRPGATWYLFVNADRQAIHSFNAGSDLTGATVLADRDRADVAGIKTPQGFTLEGSRITVEPLTAVMLRK